MINESHLRPGDVLLYAPSSLFGYAIAWLTAGRVSHVEIYKGGGISYASRDGQGVEEYNLRLSGLREVRRSTHALNMGDMAAEFKKRKGHAYDLGTIAKFLSFGRLPRFIDTVGSVIKVLTFGAVGWKTAAEVCSELAAILLRSAGLTHLFGQERADKISPRDFQKQEVLSLVWPVKGRTRL